MRSLWLDTAALPGFDRLTGDAETDTLIIGGGMAGVLCAYRLKQAGVDYMLLEADRIGHGVTGGTTAKVTYHHGMIFDSLIRRFGTERAKMYLCANAEALGQISEMCEGIDCDFEEKDSYIWSCRGAERVRREVAALRALGADARLCTRIPLPLDTDGAVMVKGQAQFHPLKFLAAISRDLNIYEHTEVKQLDGTCARTEHGTVRAKHIVVATHFPFLNRHGAYFLKLYQHRSYVLACEGAEEVNGIYADEAKVGYSFRNYGDLLLIGGGDGRTGKKCGGWAELEDFVRHSYPGAKIRYRFATQDCMTLDDVPYIGRYSPFTEGLYVATGFCKWGMTTSMAAANILCDMVIGRKNPYAEVFSPQRSILRPQLAVNGFESVKNLLTPAKRRCPHLGCALKWNSREHTWDCPCHGSRFTEDGKLIDNPATGDLK